MISINKLSKSYKEKSGSQKYSKTYLMNLRAMGSIAFLVLLDQVKQHY